RKRTSPHAIMSTRPSSFLSKAISAIRIKFRAAIQLIHQPLATIAREASAHNCLREFPVVTDLDQRASHSSVAVNRGPCHEQRRNLIHHYLTRKRTRSDAAGWTAREHHHH